MFINDIPHEPYVVDFERDDETVPLASIFTSVTVSLFDPYDTPVPAAITGAINGNLVVLTFPTSTTLFATRGLYTLDIALIGTGIRTQLDPVQIPVEARNGWHTLASARREWRDAPDDDVMLYTLLDSAHTTAIEFAPALVAGDPIPLNYRLAQLMQARNVWSAARADRGGDLGIDGMAIRTFPLDWQVKALLRPSTGVPVIA